MQRALNELKGTNELIRNTMTCLERELQKKRTDRFPRGAGQGAMPRLYEDSKFAQRSQMAYDDSMVGGTADNTVRAPTDTANQPAGVGNRAPQRLPHTGASGITGRCSLAQLLNSASTLTLTLTLSPNSKLTLKPSPTPNFDPNPNPHTNLKSNIT